MRYLSPDLRAHIKKEKKMAFIAGPRQVGKTTLVKALLKESGCENNYFNWDIETHRRTIIKKPNFWKKIVEQASPGTTPILGLDEIHKYPRWKRYLKGLYDATEHQVKMLVTGSGRLDVYQKGGDSMLGRYWLYRLHPFSVGEMLNREKEIMSAKKTFLNLGQNSDNLNEAQEALGGIDRFSGFPEPLLSGNESRLKRWRGARKQLVFREDLRDLSRIRDLGLIDVLVELLPERIGSPLSLNALKEDLHVAHGTVQTWIEMLRRLYYLFSLSPYSGKLTRTLRKEKKNIPL